MMSEKHVTAIKPTLDFRALFGVGIDTGRDAPVELVPAEKATKQYKKRPPRKAGASNLLVETGESRTPRPKEATQDILQAFSAL